MSSLLAGLNDLFSHPSVFLSTPRIPIAANSRVLIVKKYQSYFGCKDVDAEQAH